MAADKLDIYLSCMINTLLALVEVVNLPAKLKEQEEVTKGQNG